MATLRVAPEPAVAKNEGCADFQARRRLGEGRARDFAGMSRLLKFMFSMPVISHWTHLRMISATWSENLLALRAEMWGARFPTKRNACQAKKQQLLRDP